MSEINNNVKTTKSPVLRIVLPPLVLMIRSIPGLFFIDDIARLAPDKHVHHPILGAQSTSPTMAPNNQAYSLQKQPGFLYGPHWLFYTSLCHLFYGAAACPAGCPAHLLESTFQPSHTPALPTPVNCHVIYYALQKAPPAVWFPIPTPGRPCDIFSLGWRGRASRLLRGGPCAKWSAAETTAERRMENRSAGTQQTSAQWDENETAPCARALHGPLAARFPPRVTSLGFPVIGEQGKQRAQAPGPRRKHYRTVGLWFCKRALGQLIQFYSRDLPCGGAQSCCIEYATPRTRRGWSGAHRAGFIARPELVSQHCGVEMCSCLRIRPRCKSARLISTRPLRSEWKGRYRGLWAAIWVLWN